MDSTKQKLILVGVQQDDGTVAHVKGYINPTWALKYAATVGEAARFAELEVEFTNTPVAKKVT